MQHHLASWRTLHNLALVRTTVPRRQGRRRSARQGRRRSANARGGLYDRRVHKICRQRKYIVTPTWLVWLPVRLVLTIEADICIWHYVSVAPRRADDVSPGV